MSSEHTSIWKAMIKTPASIVLIVYTFLSMWSHKGVVGREWAYSGTWKKKENIVNV